MSPGMTTLETRLVVREYPDIAVATLSFCIGIIRTDDDCIHCTETTKIIIKTCCCAADVTMLLPLRLNRYGVRVIRTWFSSTGWLHSSGHSNTTAGDLKRTENSPVDLFCSVLQP